MLRISPRLGFSSSGCSPGAGWPEAYTVPSTARVMPIVSWRPVPTRSTGPGSSWNGSPRVQTPVWVAMRTEWSSRTTWTSCTCPKSGRSWDASVVASGVGGGVGVQAASSSADPAAAHPVTRLVRAGLSTV
ncbi:Uncharacterised protein [Mycobacteroides abscessus]|nr:Uncharacterised protein [Mycobacteroides abscessus]